MCEDETPKEDKIEARSGFNIGFDLDYWIKWCHLLKLKPSVPVKDAAEMMNSDETNFMKRHTKLRYTKGHVWLYLKAETKDDCEEMLKVN